MTIAGDRRRPGMPAELVVRMALVWIGVALLELAGFWLRPDAPVHGWSPLGPLSQVVALGLIMLLVGRLAFRFFDVEIAGLAGLVCAMSLPVVAALRPGEANSLAWQVVALLVALNAMMAREARRGGAAIGLALALWIALSPTGTILALGMLAILAAHWLRNRAERGWLVHALQALAAGSALAWLAGTVTHFAPASGGIALPLVAGLAWMATIVTLSAALEPHPRAFTLFGFALAATGAALIPGLVDPAAAPLRLLGLAGTRPLWSEGPLFVIQAIGLPVLALYAQVHLYGRATAWLRRWWADCFLLTVLATLLAVIDGRVAPLAAALAVVPLGWLVREWTRAARNSRRTGRRAAALAGVALAFAPALPLGLLAVSVPIQAVAAAR